MNHTQESSAKDAEINKTWALFPINSEMYYLSTHNNNEHLSFTVYRILSHLLSEFYDMLSGRNYC